MTLPTDPEARVYLVLFAAVVALWVTQQIVGALARTWTVHRARRRRREAEDRAAALEDRAEAAEAKVCSLLRAELRARYAPPPQRKSDDTVVIPAVRPEPAPTLVLTDMEAT